MAGKFHLEISLGMNWTHSFLDASDRMSVVASVGGTEPIVVHLLALVLTIVRDTASVFRLTNVNVSPGTSAAIAIKRRNLIQLASEIVMVEVLALVQTNVDAIRVGADGIVNWLIVAT